MKTILIPVDYTATSQNTVRFATEWGLRYGYDHIILLKILKESIFEYIAPMGAEYGFVNEEVRQKQRKDAKQWLNVLRDQIAERAGTSISVTKAISELPLFRSIFNILEDDNRPEMLILGSDNDVVSDGSFISDNIISIARICPVNLLIVPNGYTYQPVKNILIPWDVNHHIYLSKLENYKATITEQPVRLLVLNILTKELADNDTPVKKKEWEDGIHAYIGNIPHDIYYAFDKNIINGLINFISDHPVELIIASPGQHRYLYFLANRSISEAIYRNASQAVLILK